VDLWAESSRPSSRIYQRQPLERVARSLLHDNFNRTRLLSDRLTGTPLLAEEWPNGRAVDGCVGAGRAMAHLPGRIATPILLVLIAVPTWASTPGKPLDCSDMVFLEPRYTCTEWVPFGCADTLGGNVFCSGASVEIQVGSTLSGGIVRNLVHDNEGNQYRVERVIGQYGLSSFQIMRYDGLNQEVFARIDARSPGDQIDRGDNLYFDAVGGRLFFWVRDLCIQSSLCTYTRGWWVGVIDGFPTLADVLQDSLPPGPPGSPGPLALSALKAHPAP